MGESEVLTQIPNVTVFAGMSLEKDIHYLQVYEFFYLRKTPKNK